VKNCNPPVCPERIRLSGRVVNSTKIAPDGLLTTAAVMGETMEQLFGSLDKDERLVLELSLQGDTTREVSERFGRAERTVRLLRERIRHRLERMYRDNA
jgi:DNA-binding NarL/FixJ family response regulator